MKRVGMTAEKKVSNVAELEAENKILKAKVEELEKVIEALTAEKKK